MNCFRLSDPSERAYFSKTEAGSIDLSEEPLEEPLLLGKFGLEATLVLARSPGRLRVLDALIADFQQAFPSIQYRLGARKAKNS